MDHKGTVTLYNRTKIPHEQVIQQLKESFQSLGIYTINLGEANVKLLENLLYKDVEWLTIASKLNQFNLLSVLGPACQQLLDWITEWKNREIERAGTNGNLIEMFHQRLESAKIALLCVLLFRKGNNIGETQKYAQTVYFAYPGQSLEYLLMQGKKDNFKSIAFRISNSIPTNDFFEFLKDDLVLFDPREPENGEYVTKEGINEIYLEEIKKHFNLQANIQISQIDPIFSYIWGSFRNFRRFFNRNYLYQYIEKGLRQNGLTYAELLKSVNTTVPDLKITISNCPFPNLNGKKWIITNSGVRNSESVQNHLAIFGKDASDEFSSNLLFPNMNQLDSIFAFIYCHQNGYNIVDISTYGVLKIKLAEKDQGDGSAKVELVENMVIIFGSHTFTVNFSDGPIIDQKPMKILELKGNEECKTTRQLPKSVISPTPPNKAYLIGSGEDCWLKLSGFNGISHHHAQICYEEDDGTFKWMLRDLDSSGTYYKLKRRATQQEYQISLNRRENNCYMKPGPSDSVKIEFGMIFMIENFTFFAGDPSEDSED